MPSTHSYIFRFGSKKLLGSFCGLIISGKTLQQGHFTAFLFKRKHFETFPSNAFAFGIFVCRKKTAQIPNSDSATHPMEKIKGSSITL